MARYPTHQAQARTARLECDCVVPAKAGSQRLSSIRHWVPAFAGTTDS
jgi:hypothetical protein